MENFEQFVIVNQEFLFGGKSKPTHYTTIDGKCGKDKYEAETNTVKYLS